MKPMRLIAEWVELCPIGLANSSNDSIFTLVYCLDDAVFTPADSFSHLLAFVLPNGSLRLGAMASFCEALGSPVL
jgi:hypothetical protein